MSAAAVECPMCGSWFDGTSACDACPLSGACRTVCCPTCGYGVVDASASRVVALARRLARRGRFDGTLLGVPRGSVVTVTALPPAVAKRVAGYGIEAGRQVEVVQTAPVAVLRVDELEVALERSLARTISVEAA